MDGTVEALLQGEQSTVEQMVVWCHQGSPSARVDEVEVYWQDVDSQLTTFKLRW